MRALAFWWRRPGLLSALLAPLAWVYGAVASRRLRQAGAQAQVPVICIGNPTVGGAGKTPVAIAVARMLLAAGRRPVFLTRGYGGRLAGPVHVDPATHRASDVGDEPLLLARVAPVIVARDRLKGAQAAQALGADTIVMDDGFQNPALRKDLSILVVDGGRGLGNARVLPAGPLRAPMAAQFERAHALVVVGEAGGAQDVIAIAEKRGLPLLRARIAPQPDAIARLQGHRLLAFCGIGDPDRFVATLRAAGLDVRNERAFPDHHRYTPQEAESLLAGAEACGLKLVTTEKDWVRLAGSPELESLRTRVEPLPIAITFADEPRLSGLILSAKPR